MDSKRKRRKRKYATQVNNLKIMHWNVEGINSKIYGNKLENDNFQQIISDLDIIAFTETQCNDDTPITMPGYFVWRKTRPKHKKAKRYSGGIAICIKQQLRVAAKQIPSRSDDIMWVKLNCKALGGNHDVIVGILYISPSNSTRTKNMTEPVWDILEEELMQFNNNEQILLTGDVNAHTGSLPDYIVNDDELFCPVPDQYMVDSEMYPRMNCDKKICMYGKTVIRSVPKG